MEALYVPRVSVCPDLCVLQSARAHQKAANDGTVVGVSQQRVLGVVSKEGKTLCQWKTMKTKRSRMTTE